MNKKPYAEDYELVPQVDARGREKQTAVYRGRYFELEAGGPGLSRFKRLCLLLTAVLFLLHAAGGFVNNPGMFQAYVSLPYVAAFFPLLYLAAGVLHLPKEKPRYRRDEIGLSLWRMQSSSRILLAALALGLLGETVFLLFVSAGQAPGRELLYLGLEGLALAAGVGLVRLERKMRFKENVT
jgi:amino acid transporter